MHLYAAEGGEYYRCGGCGYDDSRLIAFYPQMSYHMLPDSELLNYFDGAVIEWEGRFSYSTEDCSNSAMQLWRGIGTWTMKRQRLPLLVK